MSSPSTTRATLQNPVHAHLRPVSGAWTLVAAAVGGFVGSIITMSHQFPLATTLINWPRNDIDLGTGFAIGALATAFAFATAVRRSGRTFVVPEMFREDAQGSELG